MGRAIAVVAALLLIVSCQGSGPHNATGTVTGGIIRCSGILISNGPHYAAGTVTVLEGKMTLKPTGQNYVNVFPTKVVAKQTVTTNGTYRFVLDPGPYVLRAQFPPPANVLRFTSVTVYAGQVLHADIPNMCI